MPPSKKKMKYTAVVHDEEMIASVVNMHVAEDVLQKAKDVLQEAKDEAKDVLQEYVCSITQELPVSPVIAGSTDADMHHIYDENAIRHWILDSLKQGRALRCPMTGEEKGTDLLYIRPCPHVRKTIEKYANSNNDLIRDLEPLVAWRKREEERKEVVAAKELACDSDPGNAEAAAHAAFKLGEWYAKGEKTLYADTDAALKWYRAAASGGRGHLSAMAKLGDALLPTSTAEAVHWYTRAAHNPRGCSERAAFMLAFLFGDDEKPPDFPPSICAPNKAESLSYLRMGEGATIKDADPSHRELALRVLEADDLQRLA